MGRTVTERTQKVVNSLLTLGLLEDKNFERMEDNLSLSDIADILGKDDYQQIQRYLKQLKDWLPDDGKGTINTVNQKIIVNKNNIPTDTYEEFLWTLLVLDMIVEQEQYSIKDLNKNFRGKALSIITKIIIAKRNKDKISIRLLNDPEQIIKLMPKSLYFNYDSWFVEGLVDGQDELKKYKLSDVKAISYTYKK